MSELKVVYRRSFQFLILPNQNYQSRSKEYNFNWCWHRTLPLKKKRFSIFENLLIDHIKDHNGGPQLLEDTAD